jgi:DNA-binding response OmpR family regulator
MNNDNKILIVEDDSDISDLLASLLSSYGCNPICTYKLEELWEIILKHDIKLALVDIMLPGIDGREVVRKMKTQDCNFPIYFMTGYSNKLTVEDNDIVDGILSKPFTVDELSSIIGKHVEIDTTRKSRKPTHKSLAALTSMATEYEALRRQESQFADVLAKFDNTEENKAVLDELLDVKKKFDERIAKLANLLENVKDGLE